MCEPGPSRDESLNEAGAASQRAVTDEVRKFYERFHFPGVRPLDQDGLILMRHLAGNLSDARAREKRPRVLDAGCGTGNTTIALARRFTDVDFLGVDISAPSLSIARKAAEQERLGNVRFHEWDLLDPGPGEGLFDVVLCLGVLHHTANMPLGLANLRGVLTEGATLYLWVYGYHGRYRHSLNCRLLDMLVSAASPAEDPVALAREFLANGGGGTVSCDLFGTGPASSLKQEIGSEIVWIADQFLHPNEILLTMESLLPLLEKARLRLARWLGVPEDPARLLGSRLLQERYDLLTCRQQLIAVDLLLKPDHYFLALGKDSNAAAPR
jgi:SAM-dependent methyltransferase